MFRQRNFHETLYTFLHEFVKFFFQIYVLRYASVVCRRFCPWYFIISREWKFLGEIYNMRICAYRGVIFTQ